jgi:hypothetical protein
VCVGAEVSKRRGALGGGECCASLDESLFIFALGRYGGHQESSHFLHVEGACTRVARVSTLREHSFMRAKEMRRRGTGTREGDDLVEIRFKLPTPAINHKVS